jgi:sec-independent protein translocase protein TatB
MFDLEWSKLALIAVVALVVIGPERLPRVAKTVGLLFGRLQRYVNDVKADIQREIELDELRKFKSSVEDAARSVQDSVQSEVAKTETELNAVAQAADPLAPAAAEPAPAAAAPQGEAAPQGDAAPRSEKTAA